MPYRPRMIRLSRDGTCNGCGRAVTAGDLAWWTRGKSTVTCLVCLPDPSGRESQVADRSRTASPDALLNQPPVDPGLAASDPVPGADAGMDLGTAGRSAMSEYSRRHAHRLERMRERWGHLAGLVLALSEDPQSTIAWQRGAVGETKLAQALAKVDRDDVIVLHDRKVPRTRGNIDHLVICPSGVFVVDSKRYEGQIHIKEVGGLLTGSDLRLFVGRRDCTRLATAIQWQVDAVKRALDGNSTPVRPVLCFIDSEWPLFGGPREFRGVLMETDRSFRHRVTRAGELDPEGVSEVAMLLADRFPAYA